MKKPHTKEPGGQTRLPTLAPDAATDSRTIRVLLEQCRDDSDLAREDHSWAAVNAFLRLERQLLIDLDAAIKRETQAVADAEQAKLAARPDGALIGSIIGAIRSMPPDQREQIMEALQGPVPLRLAKAGG